MKPLRWLWRVVGIVALLPGMVLAILLIMAFFPLSRFSFVWQPGPVTSYEEAMVGIRGIIEANPASIRPICHDQVLSHGQATERVFVLLHGLSNCPAQFSKLGEQLFARGHNVLIPRLPYHGEMDRMATDWARLTAEEMLASTNRAVDLARGLGREVIVVGLSINGTTVAWMAQNRSDISRAVMLSPFLAPAGLPEWALSPLEKLLLRLPNIFMWWNPALKENLQGPEYAYPRFPTRVIGQVMRLGSAVLQESRAQAPKAPSLQVITTGSDLAASAQLTDELVGNWKKTNPSAVMAYEFPISERVPHDFIDPNQHDQQVALVYPKLIKMIDLR